MAAAACGGDDDSDGAETTAEATTETTTESALDSDTEVEETASSEPSAAPSEEASASSESASEEVAAGGDLVVGVSSLLEAFDPAISQPVAKVHLELMYDHLVGISEDGTELSKETGIASDWTTTDSQVWDLTIRDDFTFSDGTPVTAEDVKFSLDRLKDETTATSAYSAWFRSNVDTVEVISPDHVQITTVAPAFALPIYLSSMAGTEGSVVPQAYYESVGVEGFTQAPIGSGPYKLADYQPGVSITYEKVGDHPTVDANYDTVEFRVIAESGTRRAQLETGDLDVIDVGTADVIDMQDSDAINIIEKPAGNQVGVTLFQQWNEGSPYNDPKFREALVHAVDATAISDGLFGGLAKVTGNYPSGPLSLGHVPFDPYAYDEELAKQLLSESSYNGETLQLYSFPLPGVPELTDVAQAVQGYWQNIGVNVELVPAEYSAFLDQWLGFTIDFGAAPVSFAHRPFGLAYYENGFFSEGASTVTHDPALDELVGAGRAAAGSEEDYSAATAALDQYVYDNFLSLPIAQLNSFYAAGEGIDWSAGKGQYDLNVRDLVS
jgi:peptide/nickel transport system substrate-binding protein